MSPTDFARRYKVDMEQTEAERCAAFLNAAANEMPYRFFPKPLLAKVVLNRRNTPNSDHDDVKKRLPSILAGAERHLIRDYGGREVYSDPVEGARATVDSGDLFRTKHRRKRRRVKASVNSLHATDSRIDTNELSSQEKAELRKSRKSLAALTEALVDLPQLPSARGATDVSDD